MAGRPVRLIISPCGSLWADTFRTAVGYLGYHNDHLEDALLHDTREVVLGH